MSINKTYLGYNAERLETAPAFAPYSKVIAWYDDENAFVAGDDSGRVLEVDLPFATQEIVDGMLERIRGYVYQPWAGTRAILDPAAELGDGVTINGVYSVLASTETTFDGLMLSDAAAPSDEEVDHEYHYVSPTRKALQRKVTLGANYHGASITRANGIEVTQYEADGTPKSRAKLNGDVFAMYDDSGTARLYFNPETGRYKFAGDLDISGGSINMSGGSINWGENNPASGKISASQARTLITEELVSSPTIAGGRFMDLEQKNRIEMGQSEDRTIGYLHHYVDSYSETDPVMVMGYYNPTNLYPNWVLAPFYNIALNYLLQDKTMYAIGSWNFSQADVTGLDAAGGNALAGTDCTIEADDDVTITAGDDVIITAGPIAVRFDAGNERINFWFGDSEVGYILDADGLNPA